VHAQAMAGSDPERTGLMILRAWREPDHANRLRVYIIQQGESAAAGAVVQACSSIDEACAVVRAWLVALEEGAEL
jgi:hypothetical protein